MGVGDYMCAPAMLGYALFNMIGPALRNALSWSTRTAQMPPAWSFTVALKMVR